MILEWRRKAAALAAGFATVAVLAVAPAAAQRADMETVQKHFNALLAAGKYEDALVEWQKLEAAVKARFGTEHPNYALVLLKVAVTVLHHRRRRCAAGDAGMTNSGQSRGVATGIG